LNFSKKLHLTQRLEYTVLTASASLHEFIKFW